MHLVREMEDKDVVPVVCVLFEPHVDDGMYIGVGDVVGQLGETSVPTKGIFTLEAHQGIGGVQCSWSDDAE